MKDFNNATKDPFEGEEESPRPWVLSKDDNSGLFEIHTKTGTLVCTVARQVPEKRGDWTLNRTMPNAMLIVTAVNNFDKMKEALTALLTNKHVDLGDLVYKVRDSEGKGWEGPSVVAWGKAVVNAKQLLESLENS